MTVTDATAAVGAAAWSEDQLYLKEFLHKYTLPAVVRVVKGQYCGLGASSGNPLSATSNLQSNLLLVGLGKKKRIVGQCVKFKDKDGKKKVVPVGPKLAIPSTYDGFFEILSEDGRAVRCIESVPELARRFPDSVLVRENCKALASKSDDLNAMTGNFNSSAGNNFGSTSSSTCSSAGGDSNVSSNGGQGHQGQGGGCQLPTPTVRTVKAGETLILVGEVKSGKSYLRCLDSNGENVYLPFDLRPCKFSAIAKEDNISGVHTAEKLLNSKRMPLMARMAPSTSPQLPAGLKSSSHFTSELRLFTSIDDEYVVAMGLRETGGSGGVLGQIVSLPQGAVLKVQFATNIKSLRETKEVARLCERAVALARSQLLDRITVHDVNLAGGRGDIRINSGDNKQRVPGMSPTLMNHPPVSQVQNGNNAFRRFPLGPPLKDGSGYTQNGDEYDEIEQIYDYVRGFAPLPKTARGWKYEPPAPNTSQTNAPNSHKVTSPVKDENNVYNLKTTPPLLSPGHGPPLSPAEGPPPDPPPLDTLPTRQQLMQGSGGSSRHAMEAITYPVNYAPAMTPAHHSHQHHHSMGHYGQYSHGSTATLTTMKEAKKRQRRSLVEKISGSLSQDLGASKTPTPTPTGMSSGHHPRFLKSAQSSGHLRHSGGGHSGGGGGSSHPRFFRKHSMKDMTSEHHPMAGHSANGGGHQSQKNYSSPMFQLRYKSLTNLANFGSSSNSPAGGGMLVGACSTQHLASGSAGVQGGTAEYDTLDSSNSGEAKMSTGSSSANRSSNIPVETKRSKRAPPFMSQLSRPKSLTNLVWGGFGGSTASINMRSTAALGRSGSRDNLMSNAAATSMDPSGGGGPNNEHGHAAHHPHSGHGPKYGHYHPTSSHRRRMSRENLHLTTSGGSSGTISMVHGKKLGSSGSSKRIGSLYL